MDRTNIIAELKRICDIINIYPEYSGENEKAKELDAALTLVLDNLDDLRKKIDEDSVNKDTFLEDLKNDVIFISRNSQN